LVDLICLGFMSRQLCYGQIVTFQLTCTWRNTSVNHNSFVHNFYEEKDAADILIARNNSKSQINFKPTNVKDKWFKICNFNHPVTLKYETKRNTSINLRQILCYKVFVLIKWLNICIMYEDVRHIITLVQNDWIH
jgi:hypothetical protein